MPSLSSVSIAVGLFAAFLVMVEKFSPDLREPVAFANLSEEVRGWFDRGALHEVQGRKMFAIIEGSGPETLILVHGFPTSSYDFRRAAQHLTAEHRVVTFDHLGFGFSDKPQDTYTYSMADQAEMALNLWRQLGIKSAHIVAHDMGDSVVTEILSRRQNKMLPDYFDDFFKSVTFTNGGMVYEHANLRVSQQLLKLPLLGPFLTGLRSKLPFGLADTFTRQQLRSIWSPTYEDVERREEDITDMMALLRLNGGDEIIHKTILYLNDRKRFEPRWLHSLSQLDLPCMLFWGDSDAVAPMEIPKALGHKHLASFDGKTMTNVGHFLMLENPRAFADTVRNFVAKLKD